MQSKLNVSDYGIECLEFGKKYRVSYTEVDEVDEFVFTKDNKIKMVSIENLEPKYHWWISIGNLKDLFISGKIHQVFEVREDINENG